MSLPKIAVLDYGIGNLRSAQKALQRVGADARLVAYATEAEAADGVVLPGVGSFGPCARALDETGLGAAALSAIAANLPFLGICVGLQLLYRGSDEDPADPGLGVLDGRVVPLSPEVKRPQMQWNVLRHRGLSPARMLEGMPPDPWVYFVHSFAPEVTAETVTTTDYGGEVVAGVERANLWGVQFHPEKSGDIGLALLGNFVAMCRAA